MCIRDRPRGTRGRTPESRVGLHRGWPDQDPHVGRYRGGRGGRGAGPLREGPSRAGASCRRWHRSVAGPPGPVTEEAVTAGPEGFAAAREQFATILGWLDGAASSGLDHAELENQLDLAGRELLRLLMQDHVDLRATGEPGRGGRR